MSPAQTRGALDAFRKAVETGELDALLGALAPGVVSVGDGGEVRRAAPRPIAGADKVARLLAAGVVRMAAGMTLHAVEVNGRPALVFRRDGEVDTVLVLRVEGGLITGLYAVRNPGKLSHMERETVLRR
ncbi:hypothetical protein [Streptomyces sp. NPDC126503]|uniref:hypothetical protein n=1 Tax=Streptomyces sp. NPDC126503 TaxID=3155315 RepID=UPI003329E30F